MSLPILLTRIPLKAYRRIYTTVNTAYTGDNWRQLGDWQVLKDGYVSAYGSQNPAEDFAEMVSTYLTLSDKDFNAIYITHGRDEELNIGKDYIAKKTANCKRLLPIEL